MHDNLTPEIHVTQDGSPTLWASAFGEHYHSRHGAMQESIHIFLQRALEARMALGKPKHQPIQVFEVGFGTGLNALLSALWAEHHQVPLLYTSIERYPISRAVYEQLHFTLPTHLFEGTDSHHTGELLQRLHQAPWGRTSSLSPYFHLHKVEGDLLETTLPLGIDVVYFDAFSPEAQPELWSQGVFRSLYQASRAEAILSTYCAKGEVRRRLQHAGYIVSRQPGPPGKREILSARK